MRDLKTGGPATSGGAANELVDLMDHDLARLDEPSHPATGDYRHEHTRRWSATISSLDAFVFVTPEYNSSFPGVRNDS
ncbi:NADPH-dependent FMN reductase [Nonomuraea candida]|uniref:NADPH-dependent FMN reductase n=1 Tax=Nonomuraea candida TaxID=359159 RepID=UPI0024809435|nr:NAD(P)H-dependent oxidoreductase [Nonomuraea candida]